LFVCISTTSYIRTDFLELSLQAPLIRATKSIPIMRAIQALSVLALAAPALCQNQAASIISELGTLITELPAIISEDGGKLVTDLAELISEYDPTGVVSDFPSVLATEAPVIESYLDKLITAAIPAGAVPTGVLAEIPSLVSELVPEVLTELDAIITANLPGSLSDAAIPTLLASLLPEIGTEVEKLASAALPELSSLLISLFPTAPANSTAQPSGTVTISKPSGGWVPTTTKAWATFTGAASAMAWKAEMAGIAGLAAVFAML
jgi:hypothetical protein